MDNSSLTSNMNIGDYLEHQIQTFTDFKCLGTLIANLETQQKQLEEQLQDAQSKLSEARLASKNRTSEILNRTLEFQKQYDTAQKRLMIVVSSETPEIAMKKLHTSLQKLQKLEAAHSYINLLNEVELLKDDARSHLPGNPKHALDYFAQLKKISASIKSSQELVEGATTHLNKYLQKTTESLWADMKKIMFDNFEEILEKSHWPKTDYIVSHEWSESFMGLLEFQSQETMNSQEPLILFPMRVLAKSFVLNFKYHFSGDKPTNHPHRLGDYFFGWFMDTVAKWENFLTENVKPILATHFRGSIFAGNPLCVDPVAAFITSLLPTLQEKVILLSKQLSAQPLFLCQFMVQLIDFDDSVRSRFNYYGSDNEHGWDGLAKYVLHSCFDNWFEAEKKLAFDRYYEIIHTKGSGEIDYDSSSAGKTKSTFGATQITDMITGLILKYNRLRIFSHIVKFLIEIQTEILDLYLGRLNDALEYYQTANSAVGRTIHGVTREELEELQGVIGIEKLGRVYVSSDHLVSTLRDWMNEEFFIVLYDQLQNKVVSADSAAKGAGDLTVSVPKECAMGPIGSGGDGSLFDITIEAFQRLRSKSESLITQAIKYDIPSLFQPYLTKSHWTTVGDSTSLDLPVMLVTPELDHPLQILKTYIEFLQKTLADMVCRRILRGVTKTLQDLLFNDLLIRQDFTFPGSVRFFQDVLAIQSLINCSIPPTSPVPLDMPKLRDGALLLSLPDAACEGKESYWEVSKSVYSSNKEASRTLSILGITHLTIKDARTILSRRIDQSLVDQSFEY